MSNQPIAIIGIGCRFPGRASNPSLFWELLCQGVDAITDVPPDRWDTRRFYNSNPEKPGKTYAKQGGFLQEDIRTFDPLFFGISPREAQVIDPQQRLLLEVTWEAFEDAGLVTEQLTGSETGVFIGAFTLDILMEAPLNRDVFNFSEGITNSTMTILANRLSYAFDLKGPSLAIDTACSSSLVAVHYACQSLWHGECTLAVVGGVNVMLRPEYFIMMSKGRFLSPTARCRAFDERADGYVRGEGAGVVILKPFARALRDNDPIYALIRATGCNQDGKTPGIAFPGQDSQEQLISRVYQQAGIAPRDVRYIEAHGTGTKVGDPIEANALHNVLSIGREAENKCLVGSVKSNIGHLEAAAGIAGLIKAALCLNHKKIPPNLHFEHPNPDIPFEEMCIRIPTSLEPWPSGNSIAYAGVNSFGYGGTNAHILLQEAPIVKHQSAPSTLLGTKIATRQSREPPLLIPISARSNTALHDLAKKYAEFLSDEENSASLEDFCFSTSLRRSHHPYRAAIIAESQEHLTEQLHRFAGEEQPAEISVHHILPEQDRNIVFVYTGMGPQWWAMGRELYHKYPIFCESVHRCDAIFSQYADWSLRDLFTVPEQVSRIKETQIAQPANVTLQVALTALWESWGIIPAAVVGHSVGEVTAAYISGALSLEDALLVSYHRSRLQQTRTGQGAMLAVAQTEEQAQALIRDVADTVSIAALNSPSFVALSGDPGVLQQIASELEERAIFHRVLHVDVAYHSPQMDVLQEELVAVLSALQPQETKIPLYSTVIGTQVQGTALSADYWWNNVRQPVRFAKALHTMLTESYAIFLEVGPHPVLRHAIKESLQTANIRGHLLSSLHREKPELTTMLKSLGYFYTLGFQVNWETVITKEGRYVPLPTYPWQRDYSWRESKRSLEDRLGNSAHVFMNHELHIPVPAWEVELNEYFFPYLHDHRIGEHTIFPGSAYVEAGLAIQKRLFPQQLCILEQLEFNSLLIVDNQKVQNLHLNFHPQTNRYTVYSRFKGDDSEWTRHASGKILPVKAPMLPPLVIPEIQQRCRQEISIKRFYTQLTHSKLWFGPYFRSLHELWAGTHEALGRIQGHESLSSHPEQYILHPTILDAGFQLCALTIDSFESRPWIPVSIERVTLYKSPARECWAYSRLIEQTEDTLRSNILIVDDTGHVAVEIKELCLKAIKNHSISRQVLEQCLYEFQWQPVEEDKLQFARKELSAPANSEQWLIFSDPGEIMTSLRQQLEAQNISYILISSGDSYKKIEPRHYVIKPNNPHDMKQLLRDHRGNPFSVIVYLWGLNERSDEPRKSFSDAICHCMTLMYLLRELSQIMPDETIRLHIVTHGCQVVQAGDPAQGLTTMPLWGLGRVIRLEYPNIRCQLINLDQITEGFNLSLLVKLLITNIPEPEIALRASELFVNRLKQASLSSGSDKKKPYQTSTRAPIELVIELPGSMESLMYRESGRRNPGPGEIEIKVHTSALNFKDILKVMGVIPANVIEDTYFGDCFGMECSGTVVAIGENVTDFELGDEVIAATNSGCFRSYITAPTTYIIRKPAALSLEEAPVFSVFLTAYYGLIHIARLQKGERVLIHNATGGVGLAALQIAQWIGAEIFATAGTSEKRAYLKSLGIQYVMDSRTLKFADEVRQFTGGEGVDVVLSAMSGEALYKSFNLLAPYGRFVELGKRDIAENSGLPMRAFNRNLTFSAIDLDRIFKDRVLLGRQLFQEVYRGFEEGWLHALPITVFPAAEAEQAFRYMVQSKHIGKVMIAMEEQTISVIPVPRKSKRIREDGTYLITGGTRGFGLELAQWLSAKGARSIVLISRSGVLSDKAKHAITSMESRGTQVLTRSVDVTNEMQMQQLFETIKASLPSLRGIFHGAMVLRDRLLNGLDRTAFTEIMAPKMLGALNLHKYTQNQSLDFFVLFSSLSSLTGNVGQANYAAANAFLDGFVHYRRAQELPAMTINWGVFSEVGVIARDENVRQLLRKSGIIGIHPEQALHILEVLLEHSPAQIAVVQINWRKWMEMNSGVASSPIFEHLIGEKIVDPESGETEKRQQLLRTLAARDTIARQEFLQSLLAEKFATALQLTASHLDLHQNMLDFGLDSLIAVELTNSLQNEWGFEISTMEFMRGLTIAQMATRILEKLFPDIRQIEEKILPAESLCAPWRDARLDPDIQPAGKTLYHSDPGAVLLTGATGFLGAHLLYNLAQLTQAKIYCLVRAQNLDDARNRLHQSLATYFDQFHPTNHIIPLVGDLAQPLLGLSEKEFTRLSAEIDMIYHNGASVNHLYPYKQLRASNVLSTREVLKLATTTKPKAIHYISSLVATAGENIHENCLEQFPKADPPEILQGYGYGQTKWVSEKLLAEAHQRGIGVRIFRPGLISGRSDTGTWPVSNAHLLRMIKGCIQIGYAPDNSFPLDMTPVDFLSETIVKISLCQQVSGDVFNLSNPHILTWDALIQWLQSYGYAIHLISLDAWRERCLPHVGRENAIFPLLPFYQDDAHVKRLEWVVFTVNSVNIRRSNTLSMLESLNMQYPEINSSLWKHYFRFFEQCGFIRSPQHPD